jgi:hypothetical protein
MTDWDDVGGDPCPGDVGEIRVRVAALEAVRDHGESLEGRLRDLHAGMGDFQWAGAGATAMSATVEKNVPDLAKMWTSHGDAATALAGYVSTLEELQPRASTALQDYRRAVADRARAQAEHDDASRSHSAAGGQSWQLQVELRALEAKRLAAVALSQPTAVMDARIATLQNELRQLADRQGAAAQQMESAAARIAEAESRAREALHKIELARDEHEQSARKAGDAILAAVGIVHSHNPFVRAWERLIDGAEASGPLRAALGLALDGAISIFGTRLGFRDEFGRFVSPGRLSQLEREIAAFGKNGDWLKSGPWKLLDKASLGLGTIGAAFDLKHLYDGVVENDGGKLVTGTAGIGGFIAGFFSAPLAIAAAAGTAYGDLVLPTNNDEIDGAFNMALHNQFGSAYDPANPTPEQSQWAMEHYSGVWGFFNSISDGMDYKLRWMDPD